METPGRIRPGRIRSTRTLMPVRLLAVLACGVALGFFLLQRWPGQQAGAPASVQESWAPSATSTTAAIATPTELAVADPTITPPMLQALPTSPAQRVPSIAMVADRRVASDVSYCIARPGAEPHMTMLDVYASAGGVDAPVIIYVHGGAWVTGDNDSVGDKAAYFTQRGFVFVSINYRLLPATDPAGQATDVAAAVAWAKCNIWPYGGDGNRVFLLGHSAGAHLVALVATNESHLRGVGLNGLGAIRGVILLDGSAYDVEQLMRAPEGQASMFRTPFGSDPSVWRAVSPRAHVAPGKDIPPHLMLLATSTGPRRSGAEGFAAALRAAGVYARVVDATAFRDHGTIDSELGKPNDSPTAEMQAFLDMLLSGRATGLGTQVVVKPPR